MSDIHLWGVRQNNLKDIEVKIPIGSFTVICGPSGSGKSSLAFETLFAEGQRRFVESLSNYSKQFLNKAPKPDLDGIENIPPAVSIEQKNGVKSSRSNVGTITEVLDYLRLLFEKLGHAYCPEHHIVLESDSPTSSAAKVLKHFDGKRGYILCRITEKGRLLDGVELRDHLLREGYLRVYIPKAVRAAKKTAANKKTAKKKTKKKATKKKITAAKAVRKSTKKVLSEAKKSGATEEITHFETIPMGEIFDLNDPKFAKRGLPKKEFYLVVDRMAFRKDDKGRLIDSISQAYKTSVKINRDSAYATCHVLTTDGEMLHCSEEFSCSACERTFPNISSQLFSFNSPIGACPDCKGFGNLLDVDEQKVVPNPGLTLAQGAIKPFTMPSAARYKRNLKAYCKKAKIDMHTPWDELPAKHRKSIWDGTKDFKGVKGFFKNLEEKKYKMHVRVFLARHKSPFTCPTCNGSRLRPESLQVLLNELSIADYGAMTIENLLVALKAIKLTAAQRKMCDEPLSQAISRCQYLCDVGVGYLTLDRPTKTLSGGEFQRLNLANQLGVALSQTLYVLDEPTIGLHPRDNDRLIGVLQKLNDLGNTLVVVEHDHDVIKTASHVIEMGPGSGHLGGEILFEGDQDEFFTFPESNTVPYLKPLKSWVPLRQPRPVDLTKYKFILKAIGCRGNNLKNIDVSIPLNRLVTVTGVSGSGKSSLVSHTIYPALARALRIEYKPGHDFDGFDGLSQIKNVLFIDQSPIGKTARSNPATYLKVYDAIRQIMAASSVARSRGYTPGTFSLNVKGGRCPVCNGLGHEVVDMLFMDDIEIPCDACDGKKFRKEVLDVTYKGRNIYEILNMTVATAIDFFVSYPNIRRPLMLLKEVGLEYITLGQSARSLSGGESQRLKIAKEFNSTNQKGTLYILDEPTTGLHFREVHLLLKVLNRLVDAGSSVVLIEHNLEVIRNSDYIIDIGPEAGAKGGKLVDHGTPEELMKNKKGYTGRYLKEYVDSLSLGEA